MIDKIFCFFGKHDGYWQQPEILKLTSQSYVTFQWRKCIYCGKIEMNWWEEKFDD